MSKRVLLVSARMGAGHDGAAKELARLLADRGYEVEIRDFLDAAPVVGRFLERTYELQLDHAPWSYEALFRLFATFRPIKPPIVTLFYMIFFPRMRRWVKEFGADAVITTYPFASLVLGRARRALLRPLKIPAYTFLTDFSVHTMWVDEGVDTYLAVHNISVAQVEKLVNKTPVVTGPAVAEAFREAGALDRAEARVHFGIPADRTSALIVAGSWGVGDLRDTLLSLGASDDIFPVVVCGRNEALRASLSRVGVGLVIGWTDQMPSLMRACDVMIQNAGGLTALEAFATHVPVISYNPIKGHGLRNVMEMEAAGVSLWARTRAELIETVHELGANPELTTRRAAGVFHPNPGAALEDALLLGELRARGRNLSRRRPAGLALRFAAWAIAAVTALNITVNAATQQINVDKAALKTPFAYALVNLGNQDFSNPQVLATMSKLGIGAVVTGPLAQQYPTDIAELQASGITILNGGWPMNSGIRLVAPIEAATKTARLIAEETGLTQVTYAPQGMVNSADLAWASISHKALVKPVVIGKTTAFIVHSGEAYEIDAANMSPADLLSEITWLTRTLNNNHFTLLPSSGLGN